jgi:hypothetical protein
MGTQGRRLLVIVGGGVLVMVIAVLAAILFNARDRQAQTPPPAATGGLVVQTGPGDGGKPDPKKPLRCFVNGQFEGIETLGDCARKNGVATDALDVGVDQTGALAAANGQGASITPLPPPASSETPAEAPQDGGAATTAPVLPRGPVGDCLRYAGAGWRKVGSAMSLNACVQSLFGGRCVRTGEASYGRWGDNTLRLSPHRVEMSDDNRTFRTLAEQTDEGCVIPQF